MAAAVRTADRDDVLKKAGAVYPVRQRLEWAVNYAQEDIDALRPGRREDLRKELQMYLASVVGLGSRDNMVALPSDEEMRAIKGALHEVIGRFLAGESVRIGTYQATLELVPAEEGPRLSEMGKYDMPRVSVACYALATLIVELGREGLRIKTCDAPQPRRDAICGTWFVGPAKKRYCSPHCQNRAGTRKSRAQRQVPA